MNCTVVYSWDMLMGLFYLLLRITCLFSQEYKSWKGHVTDLYVSTTSKNLQNEYNPLL